MEKKEREERIWLTHPAGIEAASLQIIEKELNLRKTVLPPDEMMVLKRAIHATADFDYAQNLVFSPQAVSEGVKALQQGRPVCTDTNMARAGISQSGLKKLGAGVYCYMTDPEVENQARETGKTRAAFAVRKAAGLLPEAVFVIGNAPTALVELAEQIRQGYTPSLVIGIPVGFVNVTEAKEEILRCCRTYHIPYIVGRGRKGGTSAAVAVINALIYEAARMTDPYSRLDQKKS